MGKGSHRRPSSLTEAEMQRAWDEAFGPRPLPNVMSERDREELRDGREKPAARPEPGDQADGV